MWLKIAVLKKRQSLSFNTAVIVAYEQQRNVYAERSVPSYEQKCLKIKGKSGGNDKMIKIKISPTFLYSRVSNNRGDGINAGWKV